MDAGWQGVRRQAMADGAVLYAVAETETATETVVETEMVEAGADETGRWLPGVEAVAVARWGKDGPVVGADARGAESPQGSRGTEPVAYVVRLERGGHGVSHPRQTGLG
jgi:hypothetical protein